MRKIICVILTLILVFSAAFAGYQIFREYTERKESADTYTDLEDLISFPEDLPEKEPNETNLSESGETKPVPVAPRSTSTDSRKSTKIVWLGFTSKILQ